MIDYYVSKHKCKLKKRNKMKIKKERKLTAYKLF